MKTQSYIKSGFILLITLLFIASSLACGEREERWSSVEGGTIQALAIDPVVPTTLYAGTTIGIFKTTVGGDTWRLIKIGPANTIIKALAVDPLEPTTVYAGTTSGMFKSTDRGETWNTANAGLLDPYISALVIDPRTSTTLYVNTQNSVYKSTDGGASWSAA